MAFFTPKDDEAEAFLDDDAEACLEPKDEHLNCLGRDNADGCREPLDEIEALFESWVAFV